MSVTETLLIFVGIPAAIVLVISALALAGGNGRRARRYRPGRPFDFTPVWFLSAPEQITEAGRAEITAGSSAPALTSGETGSTATGARTRTGATGGASDRW